MAEDATHTIDAKGKRLGRIASEAARLLMGKHESSYRRHLKPKTIVEIVNISELAITPEKRSQKVYIHHSGYPGGLKKESIEQVISKKGYKEIIERAIYGMLPGNRLRPLMMKNLIIKE